MISARIFAPPNYLFSPTDRTHVYMDKLRGLQKYGPYQRLNKAPQLGFIFPKGDNETANALYRALRMGVGLFHGMPEVFKMAIDRKHVFSVGEFTIREEFNDHDAARAYVDAIADWADKRNLQPDLLFTIHRKTPAWEDGSPYYACKAALLQRGLLSQSVTTDLMRNPTQFEWAAANIALQSFVKLGGVPWVIGRRSDKHQIIIGVGRAEAMDPQTRKRTRAIAFTTCLRSDGTFKFATVGKAVDRKEYLNELGKAVSGAIQRAQSEEEMPLEMISIHLPKEFGREEREQVETALRSIEQATLPAIHVLKVSDEDRFFLVDDAHEMGLPSRGTCVRLSHRDYLLYTEGREEKLVWRNRTPTALRIRHYEGDKRGTRLAVLPELVSQVFDLSQANWRGFNAVSRPVSILYSELVARVLAHGQTGVPLVPSQDLENRLWFL